MKKIMLLLLLISISALSAEFEIVELHQLQQIADQNAEHMWGIVSASEPIPYYANDDQIVAYRFNYAIGKSFPAAQNLIDDCYQNKIEQNRDAQWGVGKYGEIMLSARTNMPVILEHSKSLSSEYALGYELELLAQENLGNNYNLDKIYLFARKEQWFKLSNNNKEIYVRLYPFSQVIMRTEFEGMMLDRDFFCETGDFEQQWTDQLSGNIRSERSETYIPDEDLCPFYDWSYGCSPTAAAMLLAWWDNRSISESDNYAKLVDYHFRRWDNIQGSGEWDLHVPNLQEELAIAMETDSSGGTSGSKINDGIEDVCNDINGYNFSSSRDVIGSTWAHFTDIVDEIDAGRPVIVNEPTHSNCCVGYDYSAEEVIVHETHFEALFYLSRSLIDDYVDVVPGGSSGLAIKLTEPVGNTWYETEGGGEEYIANLVYDITWDSDSSAGSYVNLYISTDHGEDGTFSTIVSGTDNDGVYEWHIPDTYDSEDCRIMARLYTSSGTFAGADGSFGDFTILPESEVSLIAPDVVYNASDEGYYEFYHYFSTWCAVGIRANPYAQNWEIELYSDDTFATEIESSETSEFVDFVVIDGNHTTSQWRGIKTLVSSGSVITLDKDLEFEGWNETLAIGENSHSWPSEDVVEMWDVELGEGEYEFVLEYDSGTADLDFALFGSNGSAYYGNRNDYLARSINSGSDVDESFTYTSTSNDNYGLCVWANDNNTADFFIKIFGPNVWEGDISHNWHNPNNWSLSAVPGEYSNVTIPGGTPFSPKIYDSDAECNDLEIESGADLHIANKTLDVLRDMDINGILQMNHASGILNVAGDLHWSNGSSADISAEANINLEGNYRSYIGADPDMENGTVTFSGSEDVHITLFAGDCRFHNLTVDKSNADVEFYSTSADTLFIDGDLHIDTSASFSSISSYPIVLKGDFSNDGNLFLEYGTFVCEESAKSIELNSGDYFNDLTINTTDMCVLASDLMIDGDLLLESGGLDTDSYDVEIGGDWTNNIGEEGFEERTNEVNFTGFGDTDVHTDETFYYLNIDKSSGDYDIFELDSGITITTLDDLDITDGTLEMNDSSTLNVGNDLVIYRYAGLNAESDTNLSINVGGDWANLNTTYDTEIGFNPGISSTVTFNGSIDQDITSSCTTENFCNLVINKSVESTSVVPDIDLRIGGDFSIEYGIFWAPDEMYVAGDWYNYYNDLTFIEGSGTVTFDGSTTSYLNSDETFYDLIIDKTTTSAHGVEIADTMVISISHDLDIEDGTIEMNDDSRLFVGNDLAISFDAGLNACDETGIMIFVGDDWTNNNSSYDEYFGFNPGTSAVTFNGIAYQVVSSYCPREEFYDLNIEKTSGDFRPAKSIGVLNDLYLDWNWHYDTSGLTHYFQGDVLIDTNAVWTDNTGNICFNGSSDQAIEVVPSSNIFNNVWISSATGATVSLLSDINPISGGYLRVNSGTLDLNGNSYYCDGNIDILGGTLSVEDNECLYVGSGCALDVDSGGTLETIGTSGNEAKITCFDPALYYDFWVENGGTLTSEYTIFENMAMEGVWIEYGGIVGGSNPLYHCTFKNGKPGGKLLKIDNTQTFTADHVDFPNNTWGSMFNVQKNYDSGIVTFTNFTGSFAGTPFEQDTYDRVDWGTSTARADLVIAGVFFPGLRNDFYACDVIALELKIKNIGSLDVTQSFNLDMYQNLETPPGSSDVGDHSIIIDSLFAGDSLIVVIDNIWSDTAEEWQTYFQIDRGDQIEESDEDNVPDPLAINWQPLPVISDLSAALIHNFRDEPEIELHWTYPIGVQRFKVYKGLTPDFPADEQHFIENTDQTMFVDQITQDRGFYKITAERDAPESSRKR